MKRGDVTSAPKIVPVKEKRVKRKPLIAEAREPTLSPTKTRNIPCWDDPIKVRALTPPSNGQTFVPPNPEALKQNIRGKIQLERQEKVIEGKKEIVDEFISNVDKFESKIIVQDEKEDEVCI